MKRVVVDARGGRSVVSNNISWGNRSSASLIPSFSLAQKILLVCITVSAPFLVDVVLLLRLFFPPFGSSGLSNSSHKKVSYKL